MKKFIIAATMLFLSTVTFAQEGVTSLGLVAGFVEPVQYYRASRAADKLTREATDGFKIGFRYETGLIKGFGVAMELNYGFAADVNSYAAVVGSSTLYKEKQDHYLHYLEIPVDWQYKFMIAKKTYLTVYTGPTLQVGLSNHYEVRQKLGDQIINEYRINVYEVDEDKDGIKDYNRLNVTWGVGLGFQYDRYFIRGGYDFGIMSIYKDPYFNVTADDGWNRKGRLDQWQIKLGIYLWDNK
ncbi:MAG: hypothetical protein IKN59_02700 [Paludibacteraceae bacterium]|nr:hypothetical protein [Paludibacteraceae bacterium]